MTDHIQGTCIGYGGGDFIGDCSDVAMLAILLV